MAFLLLAGGAAGLAGLLVSGEAVAQSATKLPAARTIIDKFVRAIGGRSAILKHKSAHTQGTYEVTGQMAGTVEGFAAAPNKLLLKINLRGIGEIKQGFDGQVGWATSPLTGPRLLKGKELDQFRQASDFYSELHEEGKFQSVETIGMAEFEGKQCYKLRLVTKSGESFVEFFDAQTFLLAGTVRAQDLPPLGSVEFTTVVTGYKKFGGWLLPTRIVSRGNLAGRPYEEVKTITEARFDKVDPSVFVPPQEIKALLAAPKP